jgi:5'-3' exonuclease
MILLVDSNNLIIRLANRLANTGNTLSTAKEQEDLEKEFLYEISSFQNKHSFTLSDRVIFFFDEGKSWRYNLYDSYKANRKNQDRYSRDGLNNAINNLKLYFKESNIPFLSMVGMEADDLISITIDILWNSSAFKKDNKLVIFSNDGDLKQLIRSKDDELSFVICYDGMKEKFFLDGYLDISTDRDDFFGVSNVSEFISKVNNNCEIVNPKSILLEKLLVGDSSDNIKSSFSYDIITKKGDRKTFGFTELRYRELLKNTVSFKKEFGENLDNNLIFDKVKKFIIDNVNAVDQNSITLDKFNEQMLLNRKLLELNFKHIPDSMKQESLSYVLSVLKDYKKYNNISLSLEKPSDVRDYRSI